MGLPESCNKKNCKSQIKPQHQGLCLDGFHIPSNDEYRILSTTVGGRSVANIKLKTKTGWRNDNNGTDQFGFSIPQSGFDKYIESYIEASVRCVKDMD